MQQCGMIALKSMLAERTHVFFHTSKYMRKNLVCVGKSLYCTACHYKSRMYKLYSEVNTASHGQKPCAPNVAIHVGLQDTTMGNTKLRHILATANTPPPCRSGMQRKSNRVATITSQSTTDDLQQKREKTREINVLRGLPANAPINISMDVRYNSTSLKNSYGCGQNASQAVGTAIEWQTDKHEILGFHMENKICKLGSSLHNQGQNVSCPGHQGCTATVRVVDPISEYEIAVKSE